MNFERAKQLLKEHGLQWQINNILSEKQYHFIQCSYNDNRYTVVYNDKIGNIVKITSEG